MIRGSPDPFPIFEGGVRLRQTMIGERERANLVVWTGEFSIYYIWVNRPFPPSYAAPNFTHVGSILRYTAPLPPGFRNG